MYSLLSVNLVTLHVLCIHFHSKSAVEKVLAEGKICVLDIDTQGVRQVKSKRDLEPIFVFIKPPSIEVLEKRLRDRKTESEDNIQRRLKVAESELEYGTNTLNQCCNQKKNDWI